MKGITPHYFPKSLCCDSFYHNAKSYLIPTYEGTDDMARSATLRNHLVLLPNVRRPLKTSLKTLHHPLFTPPFHSSSTSFLPIPQHHHYFYPTSPTPPFGSYITTFCLPSSSNVTLHYYQMNQYI